MLRRLSQATKLDSEQGQSVSNSTLSHHFADLPQLIIPPSQPGDNVRPAAQLCDSVSFHTNKHSTGQPSDSFGFHTNKVVYDAALQPLQFTKNITMIGTDKEDKTQYPSFIVNNDCGSSSKINEIGLCLPNTNEYVEDFSLNGTNTNEGGEVLSSDDKNPDIEIIEKKNLCHNSASADTLNLPVTLSGGKLSLLQNGNVEQKYVAPYFDS